MRAIASAVFCAIGFGDNKRLAIKYYLSNHFIYGLATIKGHKLIQKYNEQRQKITHEETKK